MPRRRERSTGDGASAAAPCDPGGVPRPEGRAADRPGPPENPWPQIRTVTTMGNVHLPLYL
ncbi:hypothetical protein GCM10009551_018540 [Nocardiopsis tropica]